jgi:hypothetical protein
MTPPNGYLSKAIIGICVGLIGYLGTRWIDHSDNQDVLIIEELRTAAKERQEIRERLIRIETQIAQWE